MCNKVKLNLMFLAKLITILPFGYMTLLKNPIKYCERQQYFRRKVMALHNDVFLYNLNDSIQKKCLHDSSKMV